MDDTRFDDLLRSLSSGASRRGALGLLLGGSLVLLGLAETEAKKGKKGKGGGKGKGKPPPPPPFCASNPPAPPAGPTPVETALARRQRRGQGSAPRTKIPHSLHLAEFVHPARYRVW